MGGYPHKEAPVFLGEDGLEDKKFYLKWHFDNNLGPNPFKTVSTEYNKDDSKYADLFCELGLDWPAEESQVDYFFDNLNLEQVDALLEQFKNK